MSNDKMRSEFETLILKVCAWMTFERDPDKSDLYQDTEVHCAWLGYQAALEHKPEVSQPVENSPQVGEALRNVMGYALKLLGGNADLSARQQEKP